MERGRGRCAMRDRVDEREMERGRRCGGGEAGGRWGTDLRMEPISGVIVRMIMFGIVARLSRYVTAAAPPGGALSKDSYKCA